MFRLVFMQTQCNVLYKALQFVEIFPCGGQYYTVQYCNCTVTLWLACAYCLCLCHRENKAFARTDFYIISTISVNYFALFLLIGMYDKSIDSKFIFSIFSGCVCFNLDELFLVCIFSTLSISKCTSKHWQL